MVRGVHPTRVGDDKGCVELGQIDDDNMNIHPECSGSTECSSTDYFLIFLAIGNGLGSEYKVYTVLQVNQ
jgi:hypothetical protein